MRLPKALHPGWLQWDNGKERGILSMKKLLGLILAAIVAGSAATPAFAAESTQDSSRITISLSTIQSVMETYNLDIQVAENGLKTAKDSYKLSAQEKGDKNEYQIAQTNYEETVQQKIAEAKQKYLTFCAASSQLSADQTSFDNAQKQLGVDSQLLQKGYLSQSDYNTSLETMQKAQNTLALQDAKVTQDKKALRTFLNIPETENMTIQPVTDSDLDFSGISKIDYGKDVIVMRANNAEVAKASLNYSTAKHAGYTSERDIDTAKIQLEQTGSSQEAVFKQLYDSLLNSYQAYQQELQLVQKEETTVTGEQQQLSLGYLSQGQYDKDAAQLKSMKSTLASDRNNLYNTYLQYTNMKNGYSPVGA